MKTKSIFPAFLLMVATFWMQAVAVGAQTGGSGDTAVAADSLAAPSPAAAGGVDMPDADAGLRTATAHYEAGRYAEAVEAYKSVATRYGTSATLYYNLGNAYYKNKQYAQAIIQYERCLLLDPAYADAAVNLEMARMHSVDKIETIRPVIFEEWSNEIRDLFTCDIWAVLAIVLFLIFIVCLFAYFFLRRRAWRKVGFYGGVLAFLFCILSLYYADAQYEKLSVRDHAIVVAPTVTVRSSPAESGTQLFPLHEGTKVKIRSSLGEWSEIELMDGNIGWMPSRDLEII